MKSLLSICFLLLTLCACSGAMKGKQESTKETADIRLTVADFHLKMRWGLWEQASSYATTTYKSRFLGRYEELGEDYKITDLKIKDSTLGAPVTTVEVEQNWYHEPNMTLQKERFVETWRLDDGVWRIENRETKKEWKEKRDAIAKELSKTPKAGVETESTQPAAPDDTPSSSSQPE